MSLVYNSYFGKLPKIKYDINKALVNPRYQTVTNIFFRVRYIQEVLNNIDSYYVVELEEGDTPEIIAEKVYGDPGSFWAILIANQILDPQFDWPLDYDAFNKYIIGKYGSIANAQRYYHHFEMVVDRTVEPDNVTTTHRYRIDRSRLSSSVPDVPYTYYYPYNFTLITADMDIITADDVDYTADIGTDASTFANETFYTLDDTTVTIDSGAISINNDADGGISSTGNVNGPIGFIQYVNTYNFDGKTVTEVFRGEAISLYDYENDLNEQKRVIKVIKKEYIDQIRSEFNDMTNYKMPYRRLVG